MTIYSFDRRIIDPARKPWGAPDIGTPVSSPDLDHGPGPGEESLTYDETTDTGYYGLVDSGDFISGDDLCSAIGLSAGNSQHSDTPWMKFYVGPDAACNAFVRRGETAQAYVAFIPQKPIRYDLVWDDIYDAGAVFGTGDSGPYNSGSNVTQDAQVTVGEYIFKVRLPTCARENPFPEEGDVKTWTCDYNIGEGSEWNELIYRVHEDVPNCEDPTEGVSSREDDRHGGPQDGDNWETFTDYDLILDYDASGYGSLSWGQETREADTESRALRGNNGVGFFDDGRHAYTTRGFRPVLELVQA